MVGQLLAFSQSQKLQFEIFDIRDVISDLNHLLVRLVGERCRIYYEFDKDLRRIRADKRQLEQVIMNLVVNARDAMPNGGEIKISAENAERVSVFANSKLDSSRAPYVAISVSDQGTGVQPENFNRIFDPYFTTKPTREGKGLGLSTAQGIAMQLGGNIEFLDKPDRGATFIVYLPSLES